jgi:predicted transcriptional regulator
MSITTIRVESEVRDRLAALATAHGRSLGEELAAILDDLTWRQIAEDYQRLSEGELADYLEEAGTVMSADLDELAASAAEEYPEYNPDKGRE